MRRTLIVWPLPAAVIALAWLRVEDPRGSGSRVVAVLVLALLPALVRPPVARGVAAGAAVLVGAVAAADVSPLALRPFDDEPFFSAIYDRAASGLRAFYEIGLPFDAVARSEMHALVLFAIFTFALLLALAVRAGRPVLACLVLVAGAGWPSVLLVGPGDLTRGAVILATCLFLLAAMRPGRRLVRPALVAGVAVLAAALAASTSSAVARGSVLDWQNWSPYVQGQRVSVDFVWRGQYQGIRFPDHPTTVFEVQAPDDSRYWRATTLDTFDQDAWEESLRVTVGVADQGRDELFNDATLPTQARNRKRWLEQRVVVQALRDDHLPAAATPVAWEHRSEVGQLYSRGRRRDQAGRPAARRRRTRSGATPRSRDRRRSPASGRTTRPATSSATWPSGAATRSSRSAHAGREALIDVLFANDPAVAAYAPLYRLAQRVVGNAPTPYAAAVALEAWFRTGGGFVYDEQPPQAPGMPALVGFVTKTRAGYCQHYAGAMALMLRYLGIPARVAGGFTSGRWNRDRERWIVSDTDAHAWVEVWFPGYGWLPFDPTPSRGSFDAPYSNASATFDAGAAVTALGAGGGLGLAGAAQAGAPAQPAAGPPAASTFRQARRAGRPAYGADAQPPSVSC